jgi:hypothetical protein
VSDKRFNFFNNGSVHRQFRRLDRGTSSDFELKKDSASRVDQSCASGKNIGMRNLRFVELLWKRAKRTVPILGGQKDQVPILKSRSDAMQLRQSKSNEGRSNHIQANQIKK